MVRLARLIDDEEVNVTARLMIVMMMITDGVIIAKNWALDAEVFACESVEAKSVLVLTLGQKSEVTSHSQFCPPVNTELLVRRQLDLCIMYGICRFTVQ